MGMKHCLHEQVITCGLEHWQRLQGYLCCHAILDTSSSCSAVPCASWFIMPISDLRRGPMG